MTTVLALLFGYLLGSIPFGLILTRAAGLGDVRSIGSGNIGATNVLRTGNKGLAAATLLLDAFKGTAAVLIAVAFDPMLALPAGFGAFVGHLYPVWLKFKGGKGVATYLGVLIAVAWKVALVFAAVWLAVAFFTRYSSLAAFAAAVAVPVALYFLGAPFVAGVFAVMSAIIFWKHKANIERLIAGTESGSDQKDSALTARQLSHRQRVNWLRLLRTPNVGPVTFRQLIDRYGSAEAAIAMLPELALAGGSRTLHKVPSADVAEAELAAASAAGARFVAIGEPDYPGMLRQMDQPPPLIAMRGDATVFAKPAVAIVGARNASLAGLKMARMLAGEVGQAGYAVVSGLARGIDTAAHRGSLQTGTVAVLAGGVDRPYPPENLELVEEIIDAGGAIVSEMAMGWEPRAQDFPRRNRLIAGLGLGLVVVEAAQRSGSLITARLAGEMGRTVFAVPGSPLDPRAAGANGLLKDGATLVTEADDILRQLAPMVGSGERSPISFEEPSPGPSQVPPDDSAREKLIEALSPTPTAIDELVRHTGLHPAQVQLILLELDLAGRLERHAGGLVSAIIQS